MLTMLTTWKQFFEGGVQAIKKIEESYNLNLIRSRVSRMQEAMNDKMNRWDTQKEIVKSLRAATVKMVADRKRYDARNFLRRNSSGPASLTVNQDFPMFSTPSARSSWVISEIERKSYAKWFNVYASLDSKEKGCVPTVRGSKEVKDFFLKSNLAERVSTISI